MFKRLLTLTIVVCVCISWANAMPPHPDILQKILKGEMPKPIFINDPTYKARMGIDQGLPEPLLEPTMTLANYNFLAVLIGFSDKAGIMGAAFFDSLIFSGSTLPGPWGPSLRNFYNRASYGSFNITTVNVPSSIGWLISPFNRYYYTQMGGDSSFGMGTYPNNSQGLCERVVSIIDPMVNFANYDNNGDGYVDGIIIIHAGSGAEFSGDTLDIWSHAWSITPQTRDGVMISSYCVVPEYRYVAAPSDNTVGVFCHEFGHILGLPDFYDYGYDSYGLGEWSLMAYGGWNGNRGGGDTYSGCSPAFLDAYSRVFLGFVTPVNVTYDRIGAIIPAVEDSAKVYRLWTLGAMGQQYFLLEFRAPLYTDTALAMFGLTIYHVDESQPDNNSQWWPGMLPTAHYRVALEQADNFFHLEHYLNSMDAADPYPGIMGNPVFIQISAPSSANYFGAPTMVGITSIGIMPPLLAIADLTVGLAGPAPCDYLLGDINGSGNVIAADVTFGVRYLKGLGSIPPDSCANDSIATHNHYLYVAADVNSSCTFTSSDITRLVSYFKGTSVLQNCRFFPPPPSLRSGR